MAAKKKTGGKSAGSALRSAVAGSVNTDALIDLVERLGVVDLVMSRVKSKIEETNIDDLFDEATDYLKRNPEVLVVSLGALTVATGMLVWLNGRSEWDGEERRALAAVPPRARKAS